MKGEIKDLYIKRTQRDYPLSFKLAVVREVESGAITDNGAMRKYGIQGHGTIVEWRRKIKLFPAPNNAVVIVQTLPYSRKIDYMEIPKIDI